jgi:hypothetical protein
MTRLEIVWRNPKVRSRKRRWHELAGDVKRRLYSVEKLVTQGEHMRWAQASLEVVLEARRGGAVDRDALRFS